MARQRAGRSRSPEAGKGTSSPELVERARTGGVPADTSKVGSFVVSASRGETSRTTMFVTGALTAKGLLQGACARIAERKLRGLTSGLTEAGPSLSGTSGLAEAATAATVSVSSSIDRMNDGRAVRPVIGSNHGRVRQSGRRIQDQREVGPLS